MKEFKLDKSQEDFEKALTVEEAIKVYNKYYLPMIKESALAALFLLLRFAYTGEGTLLEIERVDGSIMRVEQEKFLWWMANKLFTEYYHKELKRRDKRRK